MSQDDELGLFRTTPQDPNLDRLLRWLQGRGWMKSSDIQDALGHDFNERKIRSLAEASQGQILSYPGSPGYRLTREATADERDQAIHTFRSQSDRMTRRALAISKIHRGTSAYASGY